jgi:hypothetical protein
MPGRRLEPCNGPYWDAGAANEPSASEIPAISNDERMMVFVSTRQVKITECEKNGAKGMYGK